MKNKTLLEAAVENDLSALKTLISNGEDINLVSESGAAIHRAAINGFQEIVEFLLESGAAPNITSNNGAFTALHYAAQEGHFNIVKSLIKHKADVNAKDSWGNGPLFRAGNKQEIGKYLMEHGADPYMKNSSDISPANCEAFAYQYIKEFLDISSEEKAPSFLESIIGGEIDIEERNDDGKTALYLAVEKEDIPTINLLLSKNADINTQENFGYTPLAIVCMRGKLELVKLLIKNGAKTNIELPFDNNLKTLSKRHQNVLDYLDEIIT